MITINLGAEGEYGSRLVRYLERHMGSELRLVHFTSPAQWREGGDKGKVYVMSRSFFDRLDEEIREDMSSGSMIWITDTEDEEGYCRFHPPKELVDMIVKQTGSRMPLSGQDGGDYRITGVFSPVYEGSLCAYVRTLMSPGDLYLGMEDLGTEICSADHDFPGITDQRGHMGDLCYYIHLKDSGLISRIGELAAHMEEGYEILPSPVVFLPLLELTADEYNWFFRQLRADEGYGRIYVSLGCGMFGCDGILSSLDRLILLGSRSRPSVRQACEMILRSIQAGFGEFTGRCKLVFREDIVSGGSLDG